MTDDQPALITGSVVRKRRRRLSGTRTTRIEAGSVWEINDTFAVRGLCRVVAIEGGHLVVKIGKRRAAISSETFLRRGARLVQAGPSGSLALMSTGTRTHRHERIIALCREGLSFPEIAERVGVKKATVSAICYEAQRDGILVAGPAAARHHAGSGNPAPRRCDARALIEEHQS